MSNADRPNRHRQGRRGRTAIGGEPAFTEYPLDLMLSRGLVSREQHEAGRYYAYLYGIASGRAPTSARPGPTEAQGAEIQALFRQGKNRLLSAGRRVCDATENLVVFGRHARFLDAGRRRSNGAGRADATELDSVRRGLEILVACYGRAAGRLGRMDLHTAPSLSQAAE